MKRVLIVLMALLISSSIFGENRDDIKWWLYYYGDYSETTGKNDPRVQRILVVFERVKNVADKVAPRKPRLFIIKTRNEPMALALPDGAIIINPVTLNLCYTHVEEEKGDQRAAFILGHELAHLANNDFLHREAFQALRNHGSKETAKKFAPYFISSPEKYTEFKKKELMADKMGALYASMAGYDISELLEKSDPFLSTWIRQCEAENIYIKNNTHPSLANRIKFVRAQLREVVRQIELFNVGVLLDQMGNYHDGADAFTEFAKVYPAREVYNNIGACYFNLARLRLHDLNQRVYYSTRISTTIENATFAESLLNLRGDENYLKDQLFSRYASRAEDNFRWAVQRGPQHKTSRCNLAAVLILKREYARAQAECDQILQTDPNDADALNNKALAFYFFGKKHDVATAQKAIRMLQEAHKRYPGHVDILYNLASLKEHRERLAGAKCYWERYLTISPRDNYYNHIYMKLRKKTPPAEAGKAMVVPDPPPGLKLGEEISKLAERWNKRNIRVREYKMGRNRDEANTDNNGWALDLQVMVRDKVRVVGFDGIVEIVEYEIEPGKDLGELLARWGDPGTIVHHTGGNFYVYRDRGFSFKEVNGKVKSYTWFEKKF